MSRELPPPGGKSTECEFQRAGAWPRCATEWLGDLGLSSVSSPVKTPFTLNSMFVFFPGLIGKHLGALDGFCGTRAWLSGAGDPGTWCFQQ